MKCADSTFNRMVYSVVLAGEVLSPVRPSDPPDDEHRLLPAIHPTAASVCLMR